MSIPMPGHSVGKNEIAGVVEDCRRLKELVDTHDVVFLLTDTRESRWLPTLLCADANKVRKHMMIEMKQLFTFLKENLCMSSVIVNFYRRLHEFHVAGGNQCCVRL